MPDTHALEGERKQVTILFADMKGSMELLAARDPEEARRIVDPVLERMMEAVHRFEGTVNQVMGDGIMALFGAPVAHEDHAVRGCYAALRMQESVKRHAEDLFRSQGVTVQIRIGLNSGDVLVRAIGSDLRVDYTAVGQTTHLAARMEQLARPGCVLMTTDTFKLAEGFVQATALGAVPVQGLPHPVEVYELQGAGPRRRRFEAGAAARGLTRFVGRQAELTALGRALARAQEGHGQVMAVVGELGVGKSRLLYEFAHSPPTRVWRILETGSVSYGKATAYLPVVDLFRAYFEVTDLDTHRDIRQKVVGRLRELGPAVEQTLPAFLALLDVPVEDPEWEGLDPSQRRQRTLLGIKRLLLRESQQQPLLVMFEDLHWTDSETQAVLDTLVESLRTARILLVASYRPEHEHGWSTKTHYTRLRIDPLTADGSEQLLDALLGDAPPLGPLKRLLIDRTQGNPFFLEESVRTLVETRVLVGERGAYRLTEDVRRIRVAPTVHAVLAARIDRLPPDEKALLQSASVVGKDVPLRILQAVADLPEETLRHGLGDLQATEFLYETSLFPDPKYTFKHALTHEVAYGGLLRSRRRALHARIVGAIETLYADRLTEQLDQLAYHTLQGEIWDKALAYLTQAGAKAAARSANREAIAYFEQALAALGRLPQRPEALEQAIDLRLQLRNALLQVGEPRRIIDYLREAQELARALRDERRIGRVAASMAHYFWLMGEYDQALEAGDEALAMATSHADLALEVTTRYYLGLACHSRGDYRGGAEILRQNVEALGGELLHESFGTAGFHSVFARGWLVWCLAELGEFAEAAVRGDEGLQIAQASEEPFSLIQAQLGIGGLHVRAGNFDRAIAALERALTLCRVADIRVLIPRAGASLGYAYALSGRAAEGLPLIQEAVDQAFSIPVVFAQGTALAWLGETALAAGRWADALETARRALEHARQHKERGNEAWVLRLLAEIAARQDPPEAQTADDGYRRAITLGEELGMRPLVAHCRLGLARLGARVGPSELAQAHWDAAITLFRQMGMRFWLEQAEEERGGRC